MAKKSTPAPPAGAKPYLQPGAIDDLGPADRIAREVITGRRDLLPSVARIMDAELGADATFVAIGLFRDSLDKANDPHRDPRVAIAAASGRPDEGPTTP
jgi:hypothetical protein